jgi:hypothetical protein
MARRVRPKREEFEIKESEVGHKPTNATWIAYAGLPNHIFSDRAC